MNTDKVTLNTENVLLTPKVDLGLLLLRVSTAALILFHGISHLINGVDWMSAYLGIPTFLAYGVYVGEIIAPILILVGFRARLGGLLLAGNMAVAILTAHMNDIFALTSHGGWAIELPALFLFAGATIALTGAGKYALSTKSFLD